MEAQWLGAIKSQLIGAIPADVKLVGALKGVTPVVVLPSAFPRCIVLQRCEAEDRVDPIESVKRMDWERWIWIDRSELIDPN
ncbi:MAG: hypothetical protein BJG00_014165 [Limnothrix sp. CACIAM 69d]|nr:MAG: hypothetical protein BJG00_014165 [Limnothrix sp. CACIAM 69d]